MDSGEANTCAIAAPSQVSVYAPLPRLDRPRMMRMTGAASERSFLAHSFTPVRIIQHAAAGCLSVLRTTARSSVRHGSLRTAVPADAAAAARLALLARHLAVSAHADAGRLDGFVTALRATVRRDGRRRDAAAFFASAHARHGPVQQLDAISSCAPPRLPALRRPSALSAAGNPKHTNKQTPARLKCSGPNCMHLRNSGLPTDPPLLSFLCWRAVHLARHLARPVVCRLGLFGLSGEVSQHNSL